jgi:hypothetical protein
MSLTTLVLHPELASVCAGSCAEAVRGQTVCGAGPSHGPAVQDHDSGIQRRPRDDPTLLFKGIANSPLLRVSSLPGLQDIVTFGRCGNPGWLCGFSCDLARITVRTR